MELVDEVTEVLRAPGAGGYTDISRIGRFGALAVAGVDVGPDEIFGRR